MYFKQVKVINPFTKAQCWKNAVFEVFMTCVPLAERAFEAKISDVFHFGFTLEATIDGKPLRGLVFSYKPGFAHAAHNYVNRLIFSSQKPHSFIMCLRIDSNPLYHCSWHPIITGRKQAAEDAALAKIREQRRHERRILRQAKAQQKRADAALATANAMEQSATPAAAEAPSEKFQNYIVSSEIALWKSLLVFEDLYDWAHDYCIVEFHYHRNAWTRSDSAAAILTPWNSKSPAKRLLHCNPCPCKMWIICS